MKFLYKTVYVLVFITLCLTASSRPSHAAELLRIRVENRSGGLVQVSVDGKNYAAVGKVLKAATTSIEGFIAANYIESGKIAATAVHGIRIKTGEIPEKAGQDRRPRMISLVPFEFSRTPKGFGGHIPHESGIYTDIPAGKSIFRSLAPYVGNKVFLEKDAELIPLPVNYSPVVGDVLVIPVVRPDKWLKDICFENKVDGKVTATYANGTKAEITRVEKPVEGVGRFDGTSYTGRGMINTNHPGVLTVSTAPETTSPLLEGTGRERRGGFQIVPSYHALSQPEPLEQAMIVGPEKPKGPVIEGKEPLFCDCIGLNDDPFDESHSFVVQVRIDDGKWESIPEMVGKVDNAFTAAGLNEYFRNKGVVREVEKGVTHIRILFPSNDQRFVAAEAGRAADAYAQANMPVVTSNQDDGLKVVSGSYAISAPFRQLPSGCVVMFFVDGQVRKISASTPYQFDWNTKLVKDGEHVVDMRAVDEDGNVLKSSTVKLMVKNG